MATLDFINESLFCCISQCITCMCHKTKLSYKTEERKKLQKWQNNTNINVHNLQKLRSTGFDILKKDHMLSLKIMASRGINVRTLVK